MLNLSIKRRSGLPVKLDAIELESLANLPINEAIEYEMVLRKSGRPVLVVQEVKGLIALAEVLDSVSKHSSIQTRMINSDNMEVTILDQEVRS